MSWMKRHVQTFCRLSCGGWHSKAHKPKFRCLPVYYETDFCDAILHFHFPIRCKVWKIFGKYSEPHKRVMDKSGGWCWIEIKPWCKLSPSKFTSGLGWQIDPRHDTPARLRNEEEERGGSHGGRSDLSPVGRDSIKIPSKMFILWLKKCIVNHRGGWTAMPQREWEANVSRGKSWKLWHNLS